MNLSWLECSAADLPTGLDWLGPAEVTRYQSFRFPKRQADWLLGRWTAKCALASYFSATAAPPMLREIEVRPAASGAPDAYIRGIPVTASISISHSASNAVCAIGPASVRVGCDLEIVEPRSDAFVDDFFTPEEKRIIEACLDGDVRQRSINLIWSAKESALKAMRVGLRVDTRSVVVSFSEAEVAGSDWRRLRVVGANGQDFEGWWLHSGAFVKTLLATQQNSSPALIPVLSLP